MREDPLRPQLRQIVAISGSLQKRYFRVGDTSFITACFQRYERKREPSGSSLRTEQKTFVEAEVLHFSAPSLNNNMHQILTTDLPHYTHFPFHTVNTPNDITRAGEKYAKFLCF